MKNKIKQNFREVLSELSLDEIITNKKMIKNAQCLKKNLCGDTKARCLRVLALRFINSITRVEIKRNFNLKKKLGTFLNNLNSTVVLEEKINRINRKQDDELRKEIL